MADMSDLVTQTKQIHLTMSTRKAALIHFLPVAINNMLLYKVVMAKISYQMPIYTSRRHDTTLAFI